MKLPCYMRLWLLIHCVVVVIKGSEIDQDFEGGSIAPWFDESAEGERIKWQVKNGNEPHPAPPRAPGLDGVTNNSYARLILGKQFKPAVLSSPAFYISSAGDTVSFSYWIKSRYPQFTNLELYVRNGRNEEKLIVSLYDHSSDSTNSKWQTTFAVIPASQSDGEVKLVFYGYCGATDDLTDAIAIDDISVNPRTTPTTTTTSTTISTRSTETTTRSTTTTTTTMTTTTTLEPKTCGGDYAAASGIIQSPYYPAFYGRNIECSYLITIPDWIGVQLQLRDLDISEDTDSLTVYDGPTVTDDPLRIHPGYNGNYKNPIKSTGKYMLVVFISKNSNNPSRNGWIAVFGKNQGGG